VCEKNGEKAAVIDSERGGEDEIVDVGRNQITEVRT
jgi:hypothetical protein